MNTEYLNILKQFSACRIIPGPKQPEQSLPLRALLSNVPHFFGPGGSVFIGESGPQDIKPGKVCLYSRLAGSGGILRRGAGGKYFFAAIYGYPSPGRMLGRSFGAYSAQTGSKLCSLAVEHIQAGKEGAVLYFIPGHEKDRLQAEKGEIVVCHGSELTVGTEDISGWCLSPLANAALALHIVKAGHCYAWLSDAPFPDGAGLRTMELSSFEDSGISGAYGCFDGKNAVLATSPSVLREVAGTGKLSLWLSVSNIGNGNQSGKFIPEKLTVGAFEKYMIFVDEAIRASSAAPRSVTGIAQEQVEIFDETAAIAAVVNGAVDFPDFIASGMPQLSVIFSRHGLTCAKSSGADFDALKRKLDSGDVPDPFTAEEIQGLSGRARSLVSKVFPGGMFFNPGKLKVVSMLMGNARVFSPGNGTVFISPDRPGGDIRRLLCGELLYSFALNALRSSALPYKRAQFLAEGLKYSLLSEMAGISLAEALDMPVAAYNACVRDLHNIRERARPLIEGEGCELYEGKYHAYFKPKPKEGLLSPQAMRFLAAYESAEAVKQGKFHEQTLY